jgi:hypothetical protein
MNLLQKFLRAWLSSFVHTNMQPYHPRRQVGRPRQYRRSHHDAIPACFRGKLNFRRTDPRHIKHPQHGIYLVAARRLGERDVVLDAGAHDAVMEELT